MQAATNKYGVKRIERVRADQPQTHFFYRNEKKSVRGEYIHFFTDTIVCAHRTHRADQKRLGYKFFFSHLQMCISAVLVTLMRFLVNVKRIIMNVTQHIHHSLTHSIAHSVTYTKTISIIPIYLLKFDFKIDIWFDAEPTARIFFILYFSAQSGRYLGGFGRPLFNVYK